MKDNVRAWCFICGSSRIRKKMLKKVQFRGVHNVVARPSTCLKKLYQGEEFSHTSLKMHIKSTLKHVELTHIFTLVNLIHTCPSK